MDHHELEELLSRHRQASVPEVPSNLKANVWREIRLRQSAAPASISNFDDFLGWFCGRLTFLTAPALALALLISVSWSALATPSTPGQDAQRALGLQVFSHQASAITRLVP